MRQLELLSEAATTLAPGTVQVQARPRRAVRLCIDGVHAKHADALAKKLRQVLGNDREIDFEISDTKALAGESPSDVRSQRLGRADVVVCLLNHDYLAQHDGGDLGDALVVPVAMEHLGSGVDLGSFHSPLSLGGVPFVPCGRKDRFVAELRDQIAKRLARAADPVAREAVIARSEGWERLVPDDDGPIVEVLDDTVDVQDYLRSWADSAAERPYLVIFGEYGMGKTAASQLFTGRSARAPAWRRRRRAPADLPGPAPAR